MKKGLLLIALSLIFTAQTSFDGPKFTPDGQLIMPKDYRQ
jgi:hypothetical protein